MFPFLTGAQARTPIELPLFPLKTVLFPGGVLPLKVFEQRYIGMAKACLKDERPFGVCLITQGAEVAHGNPVAPEFAPVGTLATIASWDMPQPASCTSRPPAASASRCARTTCAPDGLLVARVTRDPRRARGRCSPTPSRRSSRCSSCSRSASARASFPRAHAFDDASWVGYRLAELLPLPLSIKQGMLEINDSDVRLGLLQKFLRQQQLI